MNETHDKRAETHACDLISRQAALSKFEPWLKVQGYSEGERNMLKAMLYELRFLPSAQQWIPCSERLPEDDTLMLVNYVDHRPDAMDIWIGWHEMENVWYIDGEEHSEERGNEVVAWMPLPAPYRPKGEEHG